MSRTRTRHRRTAGNQPGRYTSIKIDTPVHEGFQQLGRRLGCPTMLETYKTVLRLAEKADPDQLKAVALGVREESMALDAPEAQTDAAPA